MSSNLIKGYVHKFGDNVNTDLISPAQYMEMSNEEIAAHAMEGADPNFMNKIISGDIIVAGKNFGSGSSRETAPIALKMAGVSVVIADYFARIFYRNSINIGLPVLMTESVTQINEGDELEVDPVNGIIKNITVGEEYTCNKLPPHIMNIIEAGGLLSYLEKQKGVKSDV